MADTASRKPLAENGIMDLSTWDATSQNSIRLDGEWEFYWQQLLEPKTFEENLPRRLTGYFDIPGLWHRYRSGTRTFSRDGYATYCLTLSNIPPEAYPLYIKLREMPTAYRLWADGELVAGNGVVGTSKAEMVPWFQPQMARIESRASSIRLTLQVSNFYYKGGGHWHSIELGTGQSFSQKNDRLMLFDMLMFGSLLIMGLYHLVLFALRPMEKAPLYFGLFCLLMGLRCLTIGQRITYMIFPGVNWEIQQKLEFILLYLSCPSFFLFFYHLFPKDVSDRIFRPLMAAITILCLTVLCTPSKIFSHTAAGFQVTLYIVAIYMGVTLVSILKRKREGGVLFLCGFIVIFLSAIHDSLYTYLIIQSRSTAHLSVFLFIFVQSFLLSMKFSAAFATIEEMTETLKEKNKKLIEADELKNEFLANTSHELRTPLHGIMGLAESVLSVDTGNLDRRQKKNLSLIAASGRRLFNLINDLLDFSMIRKKDIALKLAPVDLKSVCRLVVEFSQPLVSGKDVILKEDIPETVPPVMADGDRLQQILFNLIGNAIKFTPSGEITVRAVEKEGEVETTVADTGIGIDSKDQERIFRDFEQVDGSTERLFQGTGLGLAITRKLVNLHDSVVRLNSEPGRGSEFSFFLKAADAGAMACDASAIHKRWVSVQHEEPSASIKPLKVPLNGQKKILAVDDEPVNLQLVCNYLDEEGCYIVTTARNGHEALDIIADEHPDLILLDIMMPGLNGFDVCRKLREAPATRTLPVIILSAKNQITDLVKGLECGANDYLPKPFYREELLARIKAHLQASEATRQLEKNKFLKEEIKRRKVVEQELSASQRKLARILDCAEDAIIVTDRTRMITFFNHGAETLFGYTTNEAFNQPVDMILGEDSATFYKNAAKPADDKMSDTKMTPLEIKGNRADNTEFDARLYLSPFFIGGEEYFTLIIKPSETLKTGNSETLKAMNIQAIENGLDNIKAYVGSGKTTAQAELRAMAPDLDGAQASFDSDALNDQFRDILVETMLAALTCWELSTGKSKIDLAEESGIWKAYLDGGTWKTRTLDKYLSLTSLPGKPRWREVLRTSNYVLAHCHSTTETSEKLKAFVEQLEKIVMYKGKKSA